MQNDEDMSSPQAGNFHGSNTLTKDGVTYASYQIEHFNSEPRNKNRLTINKNNIHFSSMEEGQLLSSQHASEATSARISMAADSFHKQL